jgi:hypothetical protein
MNPDRRQFLKAGGIALALPLLESTGTAAEAASAKRLVCIGVYLGFHTPSWLPKKTGADYTMAPVLKPIERHRSAMSLFTGLDHRAPNGHRNWRNYLTGTGGNAVSFDQIVADKVGDATRFASLQLTCGQPTSQLSLTQQGVSLPPIGRPSVLFGKLFSSDSDKQRMTYILDSGRSVLDHVNGEAAALNRQLGKADQQKLDEYLTSVRDVEKKVQKQRAWMDKPVPKVDYALPKFDPIAPDLTLECESVMYDLMALALESDSTRVISFLAPGSGQVFTIGGERLSAGYHGLSHHGNDPDKIADYNRIGIEHVTRFGKFLDQLVSKKDAQGRSLLDSTAVLYGSGMGNANTHDNSNLPILLAGGGFKHGSHHIIDREGPKQRLLGDLFLTVMEQFGVEQERFQKASKNMNEYLV